MKLFFLLLLSLNIIYAQTVVIARHGEKPPKDKDRGVLNCLGENRALALPTVLEKKFGTIDAIFAPDPHLSKRYGLYSMRPLQTALPSATYFKTGINIPYGVKEVKKLAEAVTHSRYQESTVLIVWEHKRIDKIAKHIANIYGVTIDPPKWSGKDYDSLYILSIEDGKVTFTQAKERLNTLSHKCRE